MLKIFLVAGVLLILSGCGTSEKENKDDQITEMEAKDFIKKYDAAWENRDTGLMKEIMDDKYIYFTSVGSATDRARIISWFTPADKYKVDKAERNEISVTLNGNVAIVSSRWIGSGTFGNEKFNDDQRCSLVLHKMNGKIKLIAEHCTQISK